MKQPPRLTEPAIRCPSCLRRDPSDKDLALRLPEREEADRAPGGDFVILEIVKEWHVVGESPGGDMPPDRYRRQRCSKCRYEEIVGTILREDELG